MPTTPNDFSSGPYSGQRVLDLCCGQGVLARLLAERGVAQVLGVDASPQLIAAAERRERERARPGGPPSTTTIEFRVADATLGGPWADASFDRAACVMAAHDIADWRGLVFEQYKAVRFNDGRVLLFDRQRDPGETGDCAAALPRTSAYLDAWLARYPAAPAAGV